MRKEANLFESALEASNARVLAFGASVAVLNGVSNYMKALAKDTIEVGKALADINRILKVSNSSLANFGTELFKIADKTATSFEAVSNAALEFSRQGLQMNEVLERTAKTLTFVRLTGLDAKKAVELLTATVNAFNDVNIGEAINKFVAVETKFAVSARDLVEGLSRVGSAAVDVKVDLDQLNALIASVQETTARGGPVIGNALKTIFTRLQRSDTLDALSSFNIAVRDVEGNTLPAVQILQEFADSYKGLTDSSKAYMREQVAGVFQGNILSAILKDLTTGQSRYGEALDVSKKAAQEADAANAKLNRTLGALLQQTSTELTRFNSNVGREIFEPISRSLVGGFKDMLGLVNNLIDSQSEGLGSFLAKGFLKGFGHVLSGPVLLGLFAVIAKAGFNTVKFISEAVPALLHIVTLSEKRKQTEQFINNIFQSQHHLSEMLLDNSISQEQKAMALVKYSKRLTDEQNKQLNIQRSIAREISPHWRSGFVRGDGMRGDEGIKRNYASGYLPSIQKEKDLVNKGVGGAPKSSYPVVIKNFQFGGGKSGDLVANSSEFIVPNYDKKGGSAIFNQEMIKKFGMPKGAVPVAAKGKAGNEDDQWKKDELSEAESKVNDFLKNKFGETRTFEDI